MQICSGRPNYIYLFLCIDLRQFERERMRQRERESHQFLLFHLIMHSFVDSCMSPDQGPNSQPWCIGTCSNQLSYATRACTKFKISLKLWRENNAQDEKIRKEMENKNLCIKRAVPEPKHCI